MAKLSDGREIKPDFTKISVQEYRDLIGSDDIGKEDELIGRVYGMSGKELVKLNYHDYRVITKEFLTAARDPAGYDPN